MDPVLIASMRMRRDTFGNPVITGGTRAEHTAAVDISYNYAIV